MKPQFDSFFKLIEKHKSFLILIHSNPDGDAMGSSTALSLFLKKAGKKSAVLSPSAVPKRLYFTKHKDVTYFENPKDKALSKFQNSCVISIDVASDELLPGTSVSKENPVSFAIDHHRTNTLSAKEKYVDAKAASVGEILFKIIKEYEKAHKTKIFDSDICASLYTSISSDTGCFKYSNTTPFTHKTAAFLLKNGVDATEINRLLFDTKNMSQINIEQFAYKNMKLLYDNRLAITVIDSKDLENAGASEEDTEAVSQLLRMINGVQISVLMRQQHKEGEKSRYKFSVRANPDIDVSELCGIFGGGGHKKAAGCTIHDTKERAFEKFTAAAKDFLI
ncbi:MAG: DHH family phosphoesterase [Clostridiales bacterium]|nr:DHH family phosphoesterase [Clostridiales bacterium]